MLKTFLCVLALFAATRPVNAQSELTIKDILANIKTATGVAPTSETVTTSFTRNGVTGSEVRARFGKDFRDHVTLGPIPTARGSFGGVDWRQNANGETIVNASQPVEPVDEATTSVVTHVTTPTELYVIARLTSQGHGVKEYVDPSTWHIVRLDNISATETTTTTYSDFRSTAGFTRAWHRLTSDGHPENTVDASITADDAGPIGPDRLAVPKDTRALVGFPDGRTSVKLPVRYLSQFGKFVVRVVVGGRGLDFLLDSGASGIVVDRDVAQSLGLKEYDTYSNAANAGRYVGTTTIVPAMAIGDLTMHDVVVSTTPNIGIGGEDFKVVGLLGFDFIRSVALKLDYANGTVTANLPSSFSPPISEHRIDIDVRLGSSTPETSVTINGAVGTRFTLDTGGVGALMITDYFRRRYPDAVVDEHRQSAIMQFRGVGGGFQAKRVKLAEYDIGGTPFVHSGAFVIASTTSYGRDEDGIIGPDLLRIFTVYLDYADAKVYFVPNGSN